MDRQEDTSIESGVPRGRYAPSPTGDLHLGNIAAAMISWLSIRSQGGIFVLRIEDLDPPRTVAGATERIIDDLDWLGLNWDEGPGVGGPYAPYVQSERSQHYEDALHALNASGRIFPSTISRRELRDAAQKTGRLPIFHSDMRPTSVAESWYEEYRSGVGKEDMAIRFASAPGIESIDDAILGTRSFDISKEAGDFVVKRKDGFYSYQLAVAVDDVIMDMTEIIRGSDLLESTFQQIQIVDALGQRRPTYGHMPLLVDESGTKLSKRNGDLTIQTLRESGSRPDRIIGFLAFKLGLIDCSEPSSMIDLAAVYHHGKMEDGPVTVTVEEMSKLSSDQ